MTGIRNFRSQPTVNNKLLIPHLSTFMAIFQLELYHRPLKTSLFNTTKIIPQSHYISITFFSVKKNIMGSRWVNCSSWWAC